ncbi:MAG: hypothetical protein WAM42_25175 [Candidatus Nitrosopolaris sp.]
MKYTYFNLDSCSNIGKGGKDGRDGMPQSFQTHIRILAQWLEPLALLDASRCDGSGGVVQSLWLICGKPKIAT